MGLRPSFTGNAKKAQIRENQAATIVPLLFSLQKYSQPRMNFPDFEAFFRPSSQTGSRIEFPRLAYTDPHDRTETFVNMSKLIYIHHTVEKHCSSHKSQIPIDTQGIQQDNSLADSSKDRRGCCLHHSSTNVHRHDTPILFVIYYFTPAIICSSLVKSPASSDSAFPSSSAF